MVENTLIPPTFLFRIANPLLYTEQRWKKQGLELDPKYVLPSYHAELNGGPRFADLRVGWNQDGLAINLRVAGKKQAPWCRESRIDEERKSVTIVQVVFVIASCFARRALAG